MYARNSIPLSEYSGERRRAFSIVGKIEAERSSGPMLVRIKS